ncbi:hypothetical protein ACIF6K_23145 [Streptomyces sp. NPDC085942]|uniref:hypothetical protein n=1 Tax=Streptomyces sp. NPDC085942 TaxID=3365743 RepID=UPI0037D790BD
MHADVHHLLHTFASAELHTAAREFRLPRTPLCVRAGWMLVELGLRLTAQGREASAPAPRAAAFHPA